MYRQGTAVKEVCAISGRFISCSFFGGIAFPMCFPCGRLWRAGGWWEAVCDWGRGDVTVLNWCHVNLAHVSLTLQAPIASLKSLKTAFTNLEHVNMSNSTHPTRAQKYTYLSVLPSLYLKTCPFIICSSLSIKVQQNNFYSCSFSSVNNLGHAVCLSVQQFLPQGKPSLNVFSFSWSNNYPRQNKAVSWFFDLPSLCNHSKTTLTMSPCASISFT